MCGISPEELIVDLKGPFDFVPATEDKVLAWLVHAHHTRLLVDGEEHQRDAE